MQCVRVTFLLQRWKADTGQCLQSSVIHETRYTYIKCQADITYNMLLYVFELHTLKSS